MNCWESFYIKIFQQQNTLIDEQKVNDFNPLYKLYCKNHIDYILSTTTTT